MKILRKKERINKLRLFNKDKQENVELNRNLTECRKVLAEYFDERDRLMSFLEEKLKTCREIEDSIDRLKKIVREKKLKHLQNLVSSEVPAGRITKEMKKANRQLIYFEDISNEVSKIANSLEYAIKKGKNANESM